MNLDDRMKKRWKVDIIESERGWGSKIDDTEYFETHEEAWKFMLKFNERNTAPKAPDWYMLALTPKEVQE